jgi:Glycosyl hydrolases family 38 N-terminal domain
MNGSEQQIRQRLGIPSDAGYVLVIDQSAHMDWDWTSTFLENFWSTSANAVNQLLSQAVVLLSNNAQLTVKAPDLYYYSVCEIGYLQKFVEAQIAQGVDIISKLRAVGNYLRIVGGGITSPDCLLSDGEAFIRNYLVGKLWLAEALPELLPLRHCWLPDDFGQDPELPVAVKALGMRSIAFSRLPGIPPTKSITNQILEIEMLTSGADFHWVASDRVHRVYALDARPDTRLLSGRSIGQEQCPGSGGGGSDSIFPQLQQQGFHHLHSAFLRRTHQLCVHADRRRFYVADTRPAGVRRCLELQ